MRHFLCHQGLSTAALAPTSRACGMFDAAAPAALITVGGLSLQRLTGGCRTARGAIALPSVTVAANQYLHAAACAQEESGGKKIAHEQPS
jgi:hypothetical protein